MSKKSIIRENIGGVSPVIGTILLVAVTVVLAAILYVMSTGLVGGNTVTPLIGASKSNNDDSHIWTVNAITGGTSIPLWNIYIQLKNESGFVISTEPLITAGNITGCNGSHGFRYASATSTDYISVGDAFYLDKAYAQGCTITLVTPTANSLYAVFTV